MIEYNYDTTKMGKADEFNDFLDEIAGKCASDMKRNLRIKMRKNYHITGGTGETQRKRVTFSANLW